MSTQYLQDTFDLEDELLDLEDELLDLEDELQEHIKEELVQHFYQERIPSFAYHVRQKLDAIQKNLDFNPSYQTHFISLLNSFNTIINSMKQQQLPTDDMELLRSYLQQLSEWLKNITKPTDIPWLDNLANLLETLCSDPAQALKIHPELRDTNINDEMIPALLTSVYQNLNDIRLELRPKSPELAAAIGKCCFVIYCLETLGFWPEPMSRFKFLLQTIDAADTYSPAWEADVLLSQFDELGEFFELEQLITTQTNNPLFLTDVEQELSRANALIAYLIEPLTSNPGCIRQRMRQNTPPLSALIDTCSRIIDALQKLDLDASELQRLHLLLLEAYETTFPAPERTVPEITLSDTSVTPSTDTSATPSTNTSATVSTNTSATPSTSTSVTASADTNSR